MTDERPVLIVGAGPTGLTMAAELASAGVPCTVVDRRAQASPLSRAFGLMPRTMEMLSMRGELEPFLASGLPSMHAPLGDGHGYLDYRQLDSPTPYILVLPQQRTEQLLEEWAVRTGAVIRRKVRFVRLAQDADGVDVALDAGDGEHVERFSYVVGCDGVRSDVRTAAGIEFRGRDYPQSLMIADFMAIEDPPDRTEVYARIASRGMVAVYPFRDGTFRLVVLDRDRMDVGTETPVTLAELDESCQAIVGRTFGLRDPLWMSRFRSAQRHAVRYRTSRVLLAGDAAHTHIPSGGQGLQVGIQDAMNLAWKLIAELEGWAPPGLLDSYERERRPIALATLRKTDLAFRFETSNSPGARAVRSLIALAMHVRRLQVPVMEEFAGLALRYPGSRGQHPMAGRRIPDTVLRDAQGTAIPLYPLFRDRRFVLIDQSATGVPRKLAEQGWGDRLHTVAARAPDRPKWPDVLLIRPDGYIAWAGQPDRESGLRAALREWCGLAMGGSGEKRSQTDGEKKRPAVLPGT